jgi:cholesterol oxidase
MRLTEKGYSVRVLEMGKRWNKEDFAKSTWDLSRYFWRPGLGMYGILQMTMVKDAFFLHGAGVGGGSLVLFETSAPAGPHWDPHAGTFTALWSATLHQAEE